MKIVRATEEHLDLLSPLFDAYRQFYRQAPDPEGVRTFLADRIVNDESVIFLAIAGESGAGFTQLYPSFSSVGMKKLWVLNDLYVDPEYRNMGIATSLIDKARELGQETNAGSLMLETEVTNVGAQRLYEKTGWKRSTDYFVYYLSLNK